MINMETDGLSHKNQKSLIGSDHLSQFMPVQGDPIQMLGSCQHSGEVAISRNSSCTSLYGCWAPESGDGIPYL